MNIVHEVDIAIDRGNVMVSVLLSGSFCRWVLISLHQGMVSPHVELIQLGLLSISELLIFGVMLPLGRPFVVSRLSGAGGVAR